jgi:hypothetical protein
MDAIEASLIVMGWGLIAVVTAAARSFEVDNQDVGAIAAGVLWPIYLPYRLALIVRSGKP